MQRLLIKTVFVTLSSFLKNQTGKLPSDHDPTARDARIGDDPQNGGAVGAGDGGGRSRAHLGSWVRGERRRRVQGEWGSRWCGWRGSGTTRVATVNSAAALTGTEEVDDALLDSPLQASIPPAWR